MGTEGVKKADNIMIIQTWVERLALARVCQVVGVAGKVKVWNFSQFYAQECGLSQVLGMHRIKKFNYEKNSFFCDTVLESTSSREWWQ